MPPNNHAQPEGAQASHPSRDGREQQVWAFLCPGPFCDTELIILPEQVGQWVQCPTCGLQIQAPRVVPGEDAAAEAEDLGRMPDAADPHARCRSGPAPGSGPGAS
ncbi:MAG: hypothetical protein ISS74_02505 [Planctomycetes bacterium]|nr:hypothetical protein [Planctomycetota bacterium]